MKKFFSGCLVAVLALVVILIVFGTLASDSDSGSSSVASSTTQTQSATKSDSPKKTEPVKPKKKPSDWRVFTKKDDMSGKMRAFAHSKPTNPKRRMGFPYGDVEAWLGVGSDGSNEWAYIGFSDLNLNGGDINDGYTLYRFRIKFDDDLTDATGTVDFGGKFLNFRDSASIIERLRAANTVMVEVDWYGEGRVHFEFSLRGSSAALAEMRSNF